MYAKKKTWSARMLPFLIIVKKEGHIIHKNTWISG